MNVPEKIDALRREMSREGISVYIVPTSDFHDSEYVSPYFAARRFLSGFTGSAGTLVVSQEEAALFTDGRYFIQAERELDGSGIVLMKIGEEGVPTVREYVGRILPEGGNIGFDGRVVSADAGEKYERLAAEKGGRIVCHIDLTDRIWTDRPPIVHTDIFVLEGRFSGSTPAEKLTAVRKKMSEKKADVHIISSPEDICWLFDIRAKDIEYCPVALSYAAVTADGAVLFAERSACGERVIKHLSENGIELRPYDEVYDHAARLSVKRVLIDKKRVNYRLAGLLSGCEIVDGKNPSELLKAVKNLTETENIRKAHLLDGIAVTKFMIWLKKNIGKTAITETDAADMIDGLRREIGGGEYVSPSFETIAAYGANAAMMHYSARRGECAELKPEGMLLVDSGGHYLWGSTDITRTYALGEISREMSLRYTAVLKAMLELAAAKFPEGCTGENLDVLARSALWRQGLDYRCGTGHGVGYMLCVHESPNGFRWRLSEDRPRTAAFAEGMVTTDEPGFYAEGEYGIRIENELLCRRCEKTEYGQFLEFEQLTAAPIDLDCVDVSVLERQDIERLNGYHRSVFERLSPYFEGEELEALRLYTREL